jgi:hypothetical protein
MNEKIKQLIYEIKIYNELIDLLVELLLFDLWLVG